MAAHRNGNRESRGSERRNSSAFVRRNPYSLYPALYHDGRAIKKVRRTLPVVASVFMGVFFVVFIIFCLQIGFSALRIKSEVDTSLEHVEDFLTAAKQNDEDAVVEAAHELSDSSHVIRQEFQNPAWTVASWTPVLGKDVECILALGSILVDVTDNALVPLSQNPDVLSISNLFSEGKVNLDVLSKLTTVFEDLYPVVERIYDSSKDLPKGHFDQLNTVVEKVQLVSRTVNRLGPVLPYLPDMLGANGNTRTYLILANNSAEIHCSGGFVGALGTISACNGTIEMGDFRTVYDCFPKDEGSAGATEEEISLFTERCDTHHGDHNLIPDYTRVGELYNNIWMTYQNSSIDGVLSFDPVFLQYLLRLTGGFKTSFGVKVNGNNAAYRMLNKSLFSWSPSKCDAFYSEVAARTFDKVLSGLGSVDSTELMRTISQSADEGRCIIWMTNPDEEQAIIDSELGWALTHDETKPVTGIFVGDGSVSKVSYYLSIDYEIGDLVHNDNGTWAYPITVTFKNHLLRSMAEEGLPAYLKSEYTEGRSPQDLYETVYLIAPEGGKIESLSVDFSNSYEENPGIKWRETTYQGLDTWRGVLRLDKEEVATFKYSVVVSPNTTEPLTVRKSPVVPEEVAHWPDSDSSEE